MMRWVRDWETVHCISGSFFHLLNIANDNNRQECVEVILSMMPGAQRPACLFNNGEYLQSFKIFSPVNSEMRKKRGLVLTEQIIQLWLTKMKSLNINNYLATNVHEGFRKIFLANIRRQAGLLWVGSIIILTSLTFSEASPQLPFICKVRPDWNTALAQSCWFSEIQVRKVDCARRPRSVCCRNYVAPVEDNQAGETPVEVEVGEEKDQSSPDKLIQIASNIHEIVVKPNGEPIKTVKQYSSFFSFYALFNCRLSRLQRTTQPLSPLLKQRQQQQQRLSRISRLSVSNWSSTASSSPSISAASTTSRLPRPPPPWWKSRRRRLWPGSLWWRSALRTVNNPRRGRKAVQYWSRKINLLWRRIKRRVRIKRLSKRPKWLLL